MTKVYDEPIVNIRKYGVTQNIFTSGLHDGDEIILDSEGSSDSTNADNFFADGE